MNDESTASNGAEMAPASANLAETPAAALTVQLVRSVAGTRESHRATVRGLGLRKLNSMSTLEDTPSVRGMISKVSYLVKVL